MGLWKRVPVSDQHISKPLNHVLRESYIPRSGTQSTVWVRPDFPRVPDNLGGEQKSVSYQLWRFNQVSSHGLTCPGGHVSCKVMNVCDAKTEFSLVTGIDEVIEV